MSIPIRWRRWPVIAVAVVAVLLVLGRVGAGIIADYLWYSAMGATALWRERVLLTLLVTVGSAFFASAILFANLYVVRQSVVSLVLPRRVANIEIGEEVPGRYLVGAAIVISLALGWWLALPADSWRMFSLLRHGLPFGETDPFLDLDLGFYVYWLPIESILYYRVLTTALFATVIVIFFYALTPSLRWDRGSLYVSHYVRRHIAALGAFLLLLLAWSYRIDIYEALLAGSGPDNAFSYADHHTIIPVSIWLAYLTACTAVVVLYLGWVGQVRAAWMTLAAVLLVSLLLRHVTPLFMRHYVAAGAEAGREASYEATRREYTRRAYALQRIDTDANFTPPGRPMDVVGGISVWDPDVLMRALGRRSRAPLEPGTIEWSASPDGLRATVVEPPAANGDEGDPSVWTVARVLASRVESDGSVAHVAPLRSSREPDQVGPVRVADSLFGYSIVADPAGVVPAPSLDRTLPRIAYAWALQNFRLLSVDLPRPVARIVTRRDLRDRLDAIAPFFLQGTEITPIVIADSLYWAVDLYSASNSYPLSEEDSVGDAHVTYLQHAAVGVVSAQTGATWMIADSSRDPIADSWIAAFPALFASPSALPEGIAGALPPPIDAARVQGRKLARYGLRGESARRGHLLPEEAGSDSSLATTSALLALPATGATEWSAVVLDANEHAVGVLLAAGGLSRGVRWLPLSRPSARWSTVADQLRRALDTTVSVPHDAHALHGRVRIVPLANGQILFAQPLYAWRSDGASLLAVAATMDTVVTAGRTLADALGAHGSAPSEATPVSSSDFRAAAEQLYARMADAMKQGDWVAFGRAYQALGDLLNRQKK